MQAAYRTFLAFLLVLLPPALCTQKGADYGWSEEAWYQRAQIDTPLCPEGCACAEDTLNCTDATGAAQHLVIRGQPLGGALYDETAYENSQGGGSFRGARGLSRLSVRDCALRGLKPWALSLLRRLKEVDLSQNQLRSLPALTFAANDVLEKLYLSGNPLTEPPALERDSLRWLQMDDCELDNLPEGTFKGTPQLFYLSMRRNALQVVSTGALRPLENLSHLHLEDNAIARLEPYFVSRHRLLQTLYLRGNPIQLPEDEPFLVSETLLILDLANCSISNISGVTFSALPHLRSLLMAHNAIETLHVTTFDKLLHLQTLDLSHNKMVELDPLVFKMLRYKPSALLDVSGNPLGCACVVVKCRSAPRRCPLVSTGLRWQQGDSDERDICTEEEKAACLAGGAGSGAGDDADFYKNFEEDPAPDITSLLKPKEPAEGEANEDEGGASLLGDRRTQVAFGVSGAVLFVIVIIVTVAMARKCKKESYESSDSDEGPEGEAALSWTVMDPEGMRATLRAESFAYRESVPLEKRHTSSAGGVGDAWRRPRSQTDPLGSPFDEAPLDALLGDVAHESTSGGSSRPVARAASLRGDNRMLQEPYAAPGSTGTFWRNDHNGRPTIQHHREFQPDA